MEQAITLWLHGLIPYSSPFQALFHFITHLGSYPILLITLAISSFILLYQLKFNQLHIIVLGGTLSFIISSIIKLIVERNRPLLWPPLENIDSYSFPSGHALSSIVIYGLLAFILAEAYPNRKRIIYIITGVLVFLIGLSRVYIGVHWPTDVLGGWFVGAIIFCFMVWLYRHGGIIRTFRIGLGLFFLLFGVIGIVIPIIPGIPLLIAAGFLIFSDKSVMDIFKKKEKNNGKQNT